MKVVIIGFGTGGLFAATFLRKYGKSIEILVVDKKKVRVEHPCIFPFGIEKNLDLDLLTEESPVKDIQTKEYTEVIRINDKEKKIIVKNLKKNNSEEEISYDKLIIASGSRPLIIENNIVKINYNKGIFSIGTLEDAKNINNYITEKKPKKAVIIGAGAIGLEMAEAFFRRGIDTTIVESMSSILPHYFDSDMSLIMKIKLEEKGINLKLNSYYKDIDELNNEKYLVKIKNTITDEMENIEADLVLFSISKKPNVEFLKDSNIKYVDDGIFVNEKLETSVYDVYAIGDVSLSSSLIHDGDLPMRLAVPAYKGGVIVAKQIAGLDKFYAKYNKTIEHKGNYFTFASKIFRLEYASTGFSSSLAKELGYDIEVGKVCGYVKPEVVISAIIDPSKYSKEEFEKIKDSYKCTVKIIVDIKTGNIIGAQAIGKKAAEKINFLSLALGEGQNIFDFVENELAYSPLISDTYDVTMQAGELVIRKLYNKFEKDTKK